MERQIPQPEPGAPGAEPRPGGLRTFASLRHRDYRYLWFGILFMSAGQWVQQVTLGWLVYELTRSATLLGALNGLRSLPFLVSGPLAGVAADRLDRRRLLMSTQAVLFVTAIVMGGLVVGGRVEVWHLFVFTLITGVAWSINQPLRQALVPMVVPKADLMNAVALSSAGFNITKVLGPAIGGLLIAWFGAGGNFFVQAATYAAVFLMIFLMVVPPAEPRAVPNSAVTDLKDGLRYVTGTPIVLALLLASVVLNVFAVPYSALMPVFQVEVLGVGPEGLGLLLAAPGVGALGSTLLLASYTDRVVYKGRLLLGGLVALGVSLVLFSQARVFPLALLALVAVGASQIFCLATSMTMLQLVVPDALRGRVMSLAMMDRGLMPLGALVAGLMADRVGAVATVALMGCLVVGLSLLVAWRLPQLRRFTM